MKQLHFLARDDMKGFVRTAETLLEVLVLTLIYYFIWDTGYDLPSLQYLGKYVLMIVYGVLLLAFFRYSDSTKFGRLHRTDLVIGQWIALMLVNFVTYLQISLIEKGMLPVLPMAALTVVEMAVSVVFIQLYSMLYDRLYEPHNMLLIYGNKKGVWLKLKMDGRNGTDNITGMISVEKGFDALVAQIPRYDAVIINDVPAQLRNDILKYCYDRRIRTYVVPKLTDIMIRGGKSMTMFDIPLLVVKGIGLTPTQRVVKRLMDIVLSALALVVLSPLFAVIAAAIKLEDRGPVFYKQMRLTRDGREFEMIKFRSMIVDAEKHTGPTLASQKDPCITRVGSVLRPRRLDELPQFINILRGEMSIVGPRPERKSIADRYCQEIPEFVYRLKVKAGLTGYAQIYGKYNTNPYNKLRLDLMYIENYSLRMDLKLMISTLRVLFNKESTDGIDKAREEDRKAMELIREQEETELGV